MKKKKTKTKPKPKAKATKKSKTAKRSAARKPVKAKASAKKSVRAAAKPKGGKGAPRPGVIAPKNGKLLGYVEDYFAKIGVVALTLQAPVSLGSRIQILGHTTNFEQAVDSMQIEHQPVPQAGPKDAVGIKVINRARRGDHVYLLS